MSLRLFPGDPRGTLLILDKLGPAQLSWNVVSSEGTEAMSCPQRVDIFDFLKLRGSGTTAAAATSSTAEIKKGIYRDGAGGKVNRQVRD